MADWDVFVSYTHADQAEASRIQAFVEDYALPCGRRRLRVFRDKTDLRAGDLRRSIPREIANTRVLMLCCSPAAARSGWVARELADFDARHQGVAPVVPLLLAGEPNDVVPESLRGREALILDLRAGWRLGRPRGATRVELLRAVAAAADVPLRELIPWDAARRRRRWAIAGAAVAVAVASIAATGTSAWMTRREANAAALRRDAETAMLRIEAGDVAAGVAALGHALARDTRGLLPANAEVFRYWLAALPAVDETVRAERGLLRMAGRIWTRGAGGGDLEPLDVPEPFVAASPWPGTIVTAGPGGVAVLDETTGRREGGVTFPSGTQVMGLYMSRAGDALVVLGRMLQVDNDEDKPEVSVPCSAMLLPRPPGGSVATAAASIAVRIDMGASHETRSMEALARAGLFWHDCVRDEIATGEPSSASASASAPASAAVPGVSVTLDVPRLPTADAKGPDADGSWDDAMRKAWPKAVTLSIAALPAVRSEQSLWKAAGATPFEPPTRLGTARELDQAAIEALHFDDVEEGSSVFGEVVDLASFDVPEGRVFWGLRVIGNSFVGVARCTAPPTGRVTACTTDLEMSALQAWQIFSPDARRFAHLSQHRAEPPLTMFDLVHNARRAPDRQPAAPVESAVFTADHARLAVLTTADEVVVYRIAEDGTPRQERSIGVGSGSGARPCVGSETIVALEGPRIAVLSGECTLQAVDVAAGTFLWRARLDVVEVAAAKGRAQLATTANGRALMISAGARVRLVQAESGALLSAPLDLASLVPVVASSDPATAAARAADASTHAALVRLVTHAGSGAPALDIGGQLFVRAPPLDTDAAARALSTLDHYTLISTTDGRTPLDRLPPR